MLGITEPQQHFELVFHGRIPAETKSMTELQRQHLKQAYLPGSQEPRVGSWSLGEMGPHSCHSTRQLLLSLPGTPCWLCKHSQSRRQQVWKRKTAQAPQVPALCVRKQSPTCHGQRAEGSLTNILQRDKCACFWGWKQGRLFQHYSKLIPRAQVLFWHGNPGKHSSRIGMAILYLHSSLCRSFKLIVLKWTILALAGPTSTVLQEYRQELYKQTSFLSDIHCFSYIHDVPEYYC